MLRVPYGDPNWGKPQPCDCMIAERAQRQQQRYAALVAQLSSELGGELARCSLDNYLIARAAAIPGASVEQCLATMQHALDVCRAFAAEPVGWLYLYGPTGVGKSHLAAAVAQHVAATRYAVVNYASEPALMSFLRDGFDDHSTSERMRALQSCDLLVLDDVGTSYRKGAENWVDSMLWEILQQRYIYDRCTILTSNLHPDDLEARIRSRVLGRSSVSHSGREQLVMLLNADQREA